MTRISNHRLVAELIRPVETPTCAAVTLDHLGACFAIEITGRQILITECRGTPSQTVSLDSAQHEMTDAPAAGAGAAQVNALALNCYCHLLMVGTAAGTVTVHDTQSNTRYGLIMPSAAPSARSAVRAVAVSCGGKFLAAADDKGQVTVWRKSTGEVYRKIDYGYYGARVSALAVGSFGSPIVIGDTAGRVSVWGRFHPPVCALAWNSSGSEVVTGTRLGLPLLRQFPCREVSSLSLPHHVPDTFVVVGFTGGAIYCARILDPYKADKLETVDGRVRTTAIVSCDASSPLPKIESFRAIAGTDPQLYSWNPPSKADDIHVPDLHPASIAAGVVKQLMKWRQELGPLLFGFTDLRERMRAQVAERRADMLTQLKDLDEATRDRIRPVVVDSALSIFDSYSFDLAARKVLKTTPLPKAACWVTAFLLFVMVLDSSLVNDLYNLHGAASWLAAVGTFVAVGLVLNVLRRLGAVGRALRGLVAVVGMTILLLGNRIAFTTPRDLIKPIHKWFHMDIALAFRFDIPYPVWLGVVYAVVVFIIIEGVRLALRYLRAPSAVSMRRSALGGGLLHALIDIAYLAQQMMDDPNRAASRDDRRRLQQLLRLAINIASTDWVAALRTGSKRADHLIRDQGDAIATAIRRWERDAALGGAQLPALSRAFTTAVVNAADSDWQALGVDQAQMPGTKRIHASMMVRQGLVLAVPLGVAAAIIYAIRPLPSALIPVLGILVAFAVSRVSRWLDLGENVDTGLQVAQLITKDPEAKTQ